MAPVPQLGRTLLTARRRVLAYAFCRRPRARMFPRAPRRAFPLLGLFPGDAGIVQLLGFRRRAFPIVGAGCRSVRELCFVSSAAESAPALRSTRSRISGVRIDPAYFRLSVLARAAKPPLR